MRHGLWYVFRFRLHQRCFCSDILLCTLSARSIKRNIAIFKVSIKFVSTFDSTTPSCLRSLLRCSRFFLWSQINLILLAVNVTWQQKLSSLSSTLTETNFHGNFASTYRRKFLHDDRIYCFHLWDWQCRIVGYLVPLVPSFTSNYHFQNNFNYAPVTKAMLMQDCLAVELNTYNYLWLFMQNANVCQCKFSGGSTNMHAFSSGAAKLSHDTLIYLFQWTENI